MEVHHHSHTPRKKWTHYFWEFFMLFLAVFCGFLAENQREHLVEHQREKQFMSSLVEDLETDTIELQRAIKKADSIAHYADSAVMFLRDFKPQSKVSIRLSDLVGLAGQRQILIYTDRTATQLKNAGGMRLIRNKNVNNLIVKYWKEIEESNISLDRYMVYRNASREISFKLWLIPEIYRSGRPADAKPIIELEIIDNDIKKWHELTNLLSMCGIISRIAHIRNLKRQLNTANELIATIKKDYHLK
jgi:hypothetical protein